MKILDGKKLSEKILIDLKKEIKNRHLKLKLAVIWVGDDPVSKIFVRKKEIAAKKIGVGFSLYQFGKKITMGRLGKEIKEIVSDSDNSGIVIQLPLPKKMDTVKILNMVPGKKDVDVLSISSFEKFSQGNISILPPTVGAVSYLLEKYKIDVKEKYVVVVGSGRLVGKPLAAWLRLQKANFSILDKSTEDISSFTRRADILILGVGKENLIKEDMVRKGVIVLDAGTAKKNGKTVGDVNFRSVSKKASYITPVIGGVGPMTIACLLENLVKLNKR